MAKGKHGLPGQIAYTEESIQIGEARGVDMSYSRMLVKEWERYLPGGDKHHLWLQHTKGGPHSAVRRQKPTIKNGLG